MSPQRNEIYIFIGMWKIYIHADIEEMETRSRLATEILGSTPSICTRREFKNRVVRINHKP